MIEALARAVRLTVAPGAEWEEVRGQALPRPGRLLLEFILPLSCVPTLGWVLNLMLNGVGHGMERGGPAADAMMLVHGALTALAGSVFSIFLLALVLLLLAPLFERRRDWPRFLQLAAYSSAPLQLSGVLLLMPQLAIVMLLAAMQCFFVLHGGLRIVMGVKEDQAAEYVALGIVLFIVGSTLFGAVSGALGLA